MSTKNQTTLLKTCYFNCLCWENLPQTFNFCYKLEHVPWNIDLCWLKGVILDNYCYFYFQCAINLMMGPLIPACSVRMKNRAKSSRPCFGKTPTEVRACESQVCLPVPADYLGHVCSLSKSPEPLTQDDTAQESGNRCEKCPFHPVPLEQQGLPREFGEPTLNSERI